MSELKPCPWCGAQPFRMNANEEGEDPYYACPTFLCPGDQKCHNCGDQEGWMAEKWNTRATPPRAEVDVAALRVLTRWVGGHSVDELPDDVQEAWNTLDDMVRALSGATGGNDAP